VEFTIKPVLKKGTLALDANAIDNDQAAWDLISGPDGKTPLDPATVTEANGYVFGTPTVKSTEADGTLTTGVLPHGLYLVTETDASKATVNGTPVTVTSTTAPFLVTLPLPQTNGKWLYDVNVYPKNSATAAPTKTINSDADQSAAKQLKVGDTITYTIKQSVPGLVNKDGDNSSYGSARIYDTLPAGILAYDSTVSVTNSGTAFDATPGVDWSQDGNSEWTLTATGLDKIKQDDVITVVFKATVLQVTETGDIQNPGSDNPENPGYGSEFNGNYVPGTTTPYSYWGQLKVTKADESGNPLAGAHFSVYEKTGDSCSPTVPTTDPVTTGVSDSTGMVKWLGVTPDSPLGLFVANSSDGELPVSAQKKDYCVYETQAPAGYVQQTAPWDKTITPGTNAITLPVTNVQQGHPNLPLTGAAGTIVMTLGGIALVAAGGAAYAISRKKQSAR
jgi:fimbrial isopeptide formation D2 family protein/LPXTG-motif cell wall-anchored protein